MVLPAVIVTINSCVSPVSNAEASKPLSVSGVPSYVFDLLLAVMFTAFGLMVSVPFVVSVTT